MGHKPVRIGKGVYVIVFILATTMYLWFENGPTKTTTAKLRKEILSLSQQYARQLSDEMENGVEDSSMVAHDLSKPIAVVLFALMKRIEDLENQVNLTVTETLHLQKLQKLKNCTHTRDQDRKALVQQVWHEVNDNSVIKDGFNQDIAINKNNFSRNKRLG